jgi:FkbM family methyltransferase
MVAVARLGRRLGLRAASRPKHRPSAKERRAAFLEEARTFTPYVSAQCGDEVFFVPTRDDRIGARLFVKRRSKDMTVLATALGHLDRLGHERPADPVFLDVGANLGTATVTALRHHGFASAVSLEPSPGNFTALRLGLVANDLDDRVTAMQVAVSDSEGERAFDVSQASTGAHRLAADGGDGGADVVPVRAVTLDGLVAEGVIDPARVGLVWVDTAGHEANALAGGTSLLSAGIPIVVAIKHGWPETENALIELVTPYYTDVVDLRHRDELEPIAAFRALVDRLKQSTDVLLVRR